MNRPYLLQPGITKKPRHRKRPNPIIVRSGLCINMILTYFLPVLRLRVLTSITTMPASAAAAMAIQRIGAKSSPVVAALSAVCWLLPVCAEEADAAELVG